MGAAVLAKVKGFDVFLSDNGRIKDEYLATLKEWDIPFEQGGHTPELILNVRRTDCADPVKHIFHASSLTKRTTNVKSVSPEK